MKQEVLRRLVGPAVVAEALQSGVSPVDAPVLLERRVLGVGLGAKVTAGSVTGDLAVRVYVVSKRPLSRLTPGEAVPAEMEGVPTDVVAVGDIAAQVVSCGVSVGHEKVTAGTIGCRVAVAGDRKAAILSNNHVLANENDASLGDVILQPGRADGGTERIGVLADFEPLSWTAPNRFDAAIARLDRRTSVRPEIEGIGRVGQPTMEAELYQSVRKHGRTTGHTVGVVMDLSADIRVRYGAGRTAAFEDQLGIVGAGGDFSQGGDSGSLVVDGVTRRAVALLFAGGSGITFASPIQSVLDRFAATIE